MVAKDGANQREGRTSLSRRRSKKDRGCQREFTIQAARGARLQEEHCFYTDIGHLGHSDAAPPRLHACPGGPLTSGRSLLATNPAAFHNPRMRCLRAAAQGRCKFGRLHQCGRPLGLQQNHESSQGLLDHKQGDRMGCRVGC